MDYFRTLNEVDNADLTFISDKWDADMIRDGMRAIALAQQEPDIATKEFDIWTYLSKYNPPESQGFMFSDDPIVGKIVGLMAVGHSGCSMAYTMRHIQLIAKIGISAYRQECLAQQQYRQRRQQQQQQQQQQQTTATARSESV
jgi:heme exporter protein D